MVKNELGIRAQQAYNVAFKLASNTIEKVKLETTKNILNVNSKIKFNTSENEEKLYKESLKVLTNNVESLFAESELQSKAIYLDNKKEEYLIKLLKRLKNNYHKTIKNTTLQSRVVFFGADGGT